MNGAPGRKVRAISAQARAIAPGVRISMKIFMLPDAVYRRVRQRDSAVDEQEGHAVQFSG